VTPGLLNGGRRALGHRFYRESNLKPPGIVSQRNAPLIAA